MTTKKTKKDFDKEFDEKFYRNKERVWISCDGESYGSSEPEMGRGELLRFFHSQIEKILEDVMKCVPEKDKTENILEEHSFARFGYIIGFNSAIEQMIKNIKNLEK